MEEKESREPSGSMVTIQKSVRTWISKLGKEVWTTIRTKLSSKIGKALEKMSRKNSRSLRTFPGSMIEKRCYLDSGCS